MTEFSQEQWLAIKSSGGLLVSAGAGSGKTAVLVEHLIYGIENRLSQKSLNEWEIESFLKKLIVITFTVKASEEMKMRLLERLEEIISKGLDENKVRFWLKIKASLNSIYVGTIDGLFVKIINNNIDLLPVGVTFQIVADQVWKNKIKKIFNAWIFSLTEEQALFAKRWSKKIINWACEVISSTPDRILWTDIITKNFSETDFYAFNQQVCDEEFLGEKWKDLVIFLKNFKERLDENKYRDKKWYIFLDQVQGLLSKEQSAFQQFRQVKNLLAENKGLRSPSSEDLEYVSAHFKQLRQLINNYGDVVEEWQDCLNSKGADYWMQAINIAKNFMTYLHKNYGQYAGFCFSDLSYYANEVLKNPQAKLGVPNYVVVDELQDTSMLQLKQIFALTGNNPEYLYGVGDVKQAIYGFRGGESEVFFEFQKIVHEKKIDLFDNYRSVKEIVDFNNKLFSKLFSKTQSLDQVAKSTIPHSNAPAIKVIQWELPNEEKLSDWQQEILEFYGLIDQIKNLVLEDSLSSIAVLFRTNDQIKKFASLMYQENISFRVQWKISYGEDPLYLIFRMLMYLGHAKELGKEYTSLEKILKFHFSSINYDKELDTEFFFNDWILFDAYTAFYRYLMHLGVSIAYQAPFMDMLIVRSEQEDSSFESYLLWLDEIVNNECLVDWSLPFGSAVNSQIVLQTIHASKGLQYDHVLLCRISTNTNISQRMNTILGKNSPYIFRQLTFLKKSWKTPLYYKEQEKVKEAGKNESLRLFYVACTRARKTLTMSLASSVRAETWGSLVLDLARDLNLLVTMALDQKAMSFIKNEVRLIPIFQAKIFKEWRNNFTNNADLDQDYKLLPSLSVTSLVVYERCPQKFYFQNILNLDQKFDYGHKSDSLSSASRGTKVHKALQDFLTGRSNFIKTQKNLDGNTAFYFQQEGENWLNLLSYADEVHIERELRFVWKGSVILGTPDLYFKKNKTLEIWDFKTGSIDDDDQAAYILQLKWYAYAIAQVDNLWDQCSKVTLRLVQLDKMNEVQCSTNFLTIKEEISQWWSAFHGYSTKKLNHCSKCSYQEYCNKT